MLGREWGGGGRMPKREQKNLNLAGLQSSKGRTFSGCFSTFLLRLFSAKKHSRHQMIVCQSVRCCCVGYAPNLPVDHPFLTHESSTFLKCTCGVALVARFLGTLGLPPLDRGPLGEAECVRDLFGDPDPAPLEAAAGGRAVRSLPLSEVSPGLGLCGPM